MSDPESPNFIRGTGRLVTDRFDFQDHVDGYRFRHDANDIDLSPTITIDGYGEQTNVQDIIEVLTQIVNPPDIIVDDATLFQKGVVQLTGDLGGTATNVKVTKMQGFAISSLTPSTNQVLTWSGTAWAPATSTASFVASGDLSGTNISQTVLAIRGRTVANISPSNNDVLTWSSSNNRWQPSQSSPTGTGFATVTSGVFDSAATANIRYTGGVFQTDGYIQFKNSSILGNLSWSPTASNKTITLPNATDTLVGLATTDTLTNKTINATNNTITDTSIAAGDILVSNGSKFVRLAKGNDGYFLGVSGGSVGYYSPSLNTPSGTGFPTITSGVYDSNATAAIRYTVTSRFQTDNPIEFKNTSNTGELSWLPTASRTLTLPDATDTLVGKATTDTLTNKTFNVASNTLTATSQAAGDLLKNNGTQFVRMAKGTALQVLRVNSGATDLEWGTLSSGTSGTVQLTDGSGGFTAATNVKGGSGFLSVGASPATTGQIRLAGATSTSLVNYSYSGIDYNVAKVDSDNKLTIGDPTYSDGTRVIGENVELYANNGTYIFHGSYFSTFANTGIEFGGPIGGTPQISNSPLQFAASSITISGNGTVHTATAAEYSCPLLVCTGTGDGRALELPNVQNAVFIVVNAGSGDGFAARVTGQSGVSIATGKTAFIRCNGTDYVRVTDDA